MTRKISEWVKNVERKKWNEEHHCFIVRAAGHDAWELNADSSASHD
jgi:hypothetical protein